MQSGASRVSGGAWAHPIDVCRRAVLATLVVALVVAGLGSRPAEAAVTAVRGYACGYVTNVGLFGGPQSRKGCAPQTVGGHSPGTPSSLSPSVTLPGTGSAAALTATDGDGAEGEYGPATIFGGRWPEDVSGAPPSGPITVSTQGTPGGGTVTSSARISLHPTPVPVHCFGDPVGTRNCGAPGGFGPFPVEGDDLHVQCSASESGVTGSTTFVNAQLATATDADGNPTTIESVPNTPPVNYTRHGVITNVGDVFTVVYNEQIVNADGSLTVNGAHMYLFGPTAVGEVIKGQVTCGTSPSPVAPTDTVAPTCGTPVVQPKGPEDPTPMAPRTELVGVFDAGGLQSITNVRASNATVQVGQSGGFPYLQFTPGQRGPLPVTATVIDEALPMSWSFDAVDAAGNVTHCRGLARPAAAVADFDGNGTTDRSVYRNGGWYVHGQGTVFFGLQGHVPVPADYDGDGDVDRAVFDDGAWYVQGQPTVFFGLPGDIPVPGDYDGSGDAERAVFRPSVGAWYVEGLAPVFLGQAGDIPVPGDYDGNGDVERAVYRDGAWYVEGQAPVFLGLAGYVPVPADYDGNGTTDRAVFKDGGWYVHNQPTVFFGLPGHVPQPGDYDGNGTADRAVFEQGTWYTQGQATVFFGLPADIPLPLPHAVRSTLAGR